MENNHHNKIELIIDWENSLKTILRLIKETRKTIKIRMFMWRDDETWRLVLNALQNKINENPNIAINIEKDAFWTRVYNFQNFMSFWKMGWDIFCSELWLKFIKNNKNVFFKNIGTSSILLFKYNKENNHSKVFIFDENTFSSKILIGGMNISDEYLTAQDIKEPLKWWRHDYMVLINGKLPKDIYSYEFKKNKKYFARKIQEWVSIIMNIKNNQSIRKEILRELDRAKNSIIIEHWYLTDNAIIRRLRKISRKWIKIQIIIPAYSDWFYDANILSIYKLIKPSIIKRNQIQNIEIYLYNWLIHSKVILIDDLTSIIGSANLTNWSFDLLRETNAVFRQNSWITKELLDQLNIDMKNCSKITLENIPKYNKLLAWIQKMFI